MESLLEYNSKFIGTSQRVNPELYKGIVKKVRKYYRKNSPYGCAQNIRAEVRDIDKAVEANRLRERMVDEFADGEMQKLNLFKTNKLKFKNSQIVHINPRPIHIKRLSDGAIDQKNNLNVSFFEKRAKKGESNKPRTAEVKIRKNDEPFNHKKNSASSFQRPLTGLTGNKRKIMRLASLDDIMRSCDELQPRIKPEIDFIENSQQELVSSTKNMKEYINDLEDCMKLAEDAKKMEKLMEICRNSRKITRIMSVEPGIKDEMLTVTRKLVQLGGYKV